MPSTRHDRMQMQAHQAWEFMAVLEVLCPRCGGSAQANLHGTDIDRQVVLFGARHLTCTACGYSRHQSALMRSNPSMGCELRLKAVTLWGELIFYNRDHLAYIATYIAARHRHVRYEVSGPRNDTILSRLPRWAKLASHRDEILAAILRIEAR